VSEAALVGSKKAIVPPPEVVLPAPYYALLVLELGGLIAVHTLRPEESGSQPISFALGWAGTASMLVMHVYSLRKRVKALWHLGKLRYWLHFHIFMGLQGALLVVYHSLHLRTPATIQGANILMIGIVVLSGVFGRYVYAFIPKSLAGERLTARQVEDELASLNRDLEAEPPTAELGKAIADSNAAVKLAAGARHSLGELISEDLRARRALADLERARRAARGRRVDSTLEQIERLDRFYAAARRRVLLSRRLITFDAADRLFRGWHILHKPLTYLLAAATILHVMAHYMYASGMSG
jgi:hypothetical protein